MAQVYFISDTHFSHENILYFSPKRREAAGISLEELQADRRAAIAKHDEWLVNLWNNTVNKHDTIYILGDFCLGNKNRAEELLKKLNGHKHLILGNHDKSCNGLENYFESVSTIKEVKFNHQMYEFIRPDETFCIDMSHRPGFTWYRRTHGCCHLHGHTHGGMMDDINTQSGELRIDAGFDAKLAECNFISLEKLYNAFSDIMKTTESSTFKEHTSKIMEKQGFRL